MMQQTEQAILDVVAQGWSLESAASFGTRRVWRPDGQVGISAQLDENGDETADWEILGADGSEMGPDERGLALDTALNMAERW